MPVIAGSSGHPDLIYRRFIAHCRRCGQCRQVGGERAPADALCQTGRALVEGWESAELVWAALRRSSARV